MKKLKFFLISLVAAVTLIAGLSSCGGGSGSSNSGSSNKKISTVEEAQRYIDGKIFTATDPVQYGEYWIKLTISGSSATIQFGLPQYEGWGNSDPEQYVIEEERYLDTGERYYAINFGCYKFNISNLTFSNCRGYAQKAKIGDKYPWK
ncbi:MAG: hypothetical protein LBS16_07910 [Prevotellaceae bacterium]|jgi:hypothetical protein|nr:hypothetical protein [Prevotellaceae bacterium]